MVDAEVEPGELLGSQPLYPVRRQSLVSRPQPQDSSAHTAVAVAVPSLHGQLHEEIPATHTQTGVINIDSSSHTAVAQTAVINIDSSSHTAVAVSSCHAQLHHKIPATRTQTAVINVDSSSHTAAAVPSRRSQLHQEIPATHRYMHACTHTHTHTNTHTHSLHTNRTHPYCSSNHNCGKIFENGASREEKRTNIQTHKKEFHSKHTKHCFAFPFLFCSSKICTTKVKKIHQNDVYLNFPSHCSASTAAAMGLYV